MRRICITLGLVMLMASPVAAAPLHHFASDGVPFDYQAERLADGSIRLSGQMNDTREPFEFRVAARRVVGHVGSRDVAFMISKATAERLKGEVPATAVALATN
jgi:hypothetical protein